MKGHVCHRGSVPERAGLDSCVPHEEQRDEHGHSNSENLYVSGMNQVLYHITNWSGNGRELRGICEISKQTIELARMNECKSVP